MPTVRRSRTLRATPEELWAIVGDAYHLPRWWPRVTRVEGVEDDAFTQVLTTAKGVPVRADFRVVESAAPRVRRWAQQLVNTPFERVLAASEIEVRLEPEGDAATRVECRSSSACGGWRCWARSWPATPAGASSTMR